VKHAHVIAAVLVVALVAKSDGALTAGTWVGIILGALVLVWIGSPRASRAGRAEPRPPTRLEVLRSRYARGLLTLLPEFEAEVATLLAEGRADKRWT
jgi:hypothetical protein